MQKKLAIRTIFIMILLCACTPGLEIEAQAYWVRAAHMGDNSVVYMNLHNYSLENDVLIGVSSDAAEKVEIHESRISPEGNAQMVLRTYVPLNAGEEIEFKPGGLHIMLMNLNQDLNPGDRISVILHFERTGEISLTVPVEITSFR